MKKYAFVLLLLLVIHKLQAQDYKISFVGSGASNTIDLISVENLTSQIKIDIKGTDILRLIFSYTDIYSIIKQVRDQDNNSLKIYPNPMTEEAIIEFDAITKGTSNICIFDITGKKVGSAQNMLDIGHHAYKISGLVLGVYIIKVFSKDYCFSGKLISNCLNKYVPQITYNGFSEKLFTPLQLKSAESEFFMRYNYGEKLKITGTSGIYTSIITDVPQQNKTINIPFVKCTDAAGSNYPIMRINTQIWMAENLKINKYNDGTYITYIYDSIKWSQLSASAYGNYEKGVGKYGLLYNWYAVNDVRGIAPKGWHIASDAEWVTAINNLGGESIAGGIMKETGTGYWNDPNTGATNEVGFNARAGGYRYSDGTFCDLKKNANWWTSDEDSKDSAIQRSIFESSSIIVKKEVAKTNGFSVRCIYDLPGNPEVPRLSTIQASDVTTSVANIGGNIVSDGGAPISASGVCWSIKGYPSTDDNKTTEKTNIGGFISKLDNFKPNTTYFVRAYATNEAGTSYGNIENFTTKPDIKTDPVTDIEGNVYQTVKIGQQVWMAENLKTTTYNDGIKIPNITVMNEWYQFNKPAYCWYNNDILNKETYGAIYNWFTVDTKKLCPIGWHVPSDEEWHTLIMYLETSPNPGWSESQTVSFKLVEKGTQHWLKTNQDISNGSGFTTLPGGRRTNYGSFDGFGSAAVFWSSTPNVTMAYERSFGIGGPVSRNFFSMAYGCSVRCIRD